MKIYVGTSGYSYPEWKGYFYPKELPNGQMLKYYGEHLPSVELNNTFYRLPNVSLIENWGKAVPGSFKFSVKASQKITHLKRLRNAGTETSYLINTVRALGEKLGVLLFQCPPNFRKDLDRLKEFTQLLPQDIHCAFEFRHPTWFDDEVYDVLREKDLALCGADTEEAPIKRLVSTARWGYLRLRRPGYSRSDVKHWLKMILDQQWETAFVFFKHEEKGVGASLALQLLELFQQRSEKRA